MSCYLRLLLLGIMTISRYKSFACEILRIYRSDKVLGISYSDFCISKFIGLEVECTDLTDLSLTCEVVFQRPLVKDGQIHQKEMGISDGQSHLRKDQPVKLLLWMLPAPLQLSWMAERVFKWLPWPSPNWGELEVLEEVMQRKAVKTVALANTDLPGGVCCSHC